MACHTGRTAWQQLLWGLAAMYISIYFYCYKIKQYQYTGYRRLSDTHSQHHTVMLFHVLLPPPSCIAVHSSQHPDSETEGILSFIDKPR